VARARTAKIALAWLAEHRAALAKKRKSPPTTIDNDNVPDGSAAVTDPTTDIEAFNAGWAAMATAPVAVTAA
jgi:hypothetical protein